MKEISYLPDDTVEAVLEPLNGLGIVDAVVDTDLGLAAAALGDVLTGTGPVENQLVSSSHFGVFCGCRERCTHMQQ